MCTTDLSELFYFVDCKISIVDNGPRQFIQAFLCDF